MAEFPAMPLWTDAYLGDTHHLNALEHGAYFLLLMAMWRSGECRLPADDATLARYSHTGPRTWRKIKPTLMRFFKLDGEHITQSRLADEWSHVRQTSERNAAAANAKWLKNKKPRHANASSRQSNRNAPTPTPTPTNKIVNLEFEKFRKAYPKRKGDQGWNETEKLFNKAIKDGHDAAILISAAAKFAKTMESSVGTEFIPMARTWVYQKRFLEFLPSAEDLEKEAKIAEFMRGKGKQWVDGQGWVAIENTS